MYEVAAGVRSTRNADGGIVLDIDQGKIFRLNGIAALIFERLERRQTRAQIIEEISKEFEISTSTAETDVFEFLESLREQGLVQGSAEESS